MLVACHWFEPASSNQRRVLSLCSQLFALCCLSLHVNWCIFIRFVFPDIEGGWLATMMIRSPFFA